MNYGQLKDAVAGYLHRTDGAPLMDTWRDLAEARIYYGEANAPALRISSMATTADMPTAARPADFLEARLVHVVGDAKQTLNLIALKDVAMGFRNFAWDGNDIVLSSDQTLPITLNYYAKFTPLVADGDTNALLTMRPNIYLSSMLVDAARWARDDALGAREAANYASAVSSLHSSDNAAKYSGSLLTMKLQGGYRGR